MACISTFFNGLHVTYVDDREQYDVVDGASSELTPVISGEQRDQYRDCYCSLFT